MSTPALPRLDLRPPGDTAARRTFVERCRRSSGLAGEADEAARIVIEDVRARGDLAVAEATLRYEARTLRPEEFELDAATRAAACARVAPEVRRALEHASERIHRFHLTQHERTTGSSEPGAILQSRVTPLRRVALYVPGGTAAYPSSVLMSAIPARVAGVEELVMLTPRASDVVLLAAEIAGVNRVFAVGGAQAIAAVAFGTQRIPAVDKIVGPGNAYVTAAKRRVFGTVAIDGIAGPSEILVIADDRADPELVAADLLSQAEHDVLACPILVTDSERLADAVDAALLRQLESLPRRSIAERAIREQGAAILVAGREAMVEVADAYASEHVALLVDRPGELAAVIRNAGAVFVGPATPEAAGDYTAGPSHVLPTAGAARFASPLGVWDFVKRTSVLELDLDGLRAQASAITTLARAEGLEAHARAVELRLRGT